MLFQPLDLTTALRPSLFPDETLLFVQDGVGLYEGKFKIPAFQNGHAYLTSHRVCYVDNADPRKNSIGIELKGIERYDFYAGFLKSSPKVILYPKPIKRSPYSSQGRSVPPVSLQVAHLPRNAIASPGTRASIPSNFDAASANVNTPLLPCLACGIKPPLAHILKAAIASASGRANSSQLSIPTPGQGDQRDPAINRSSNEGHRRPPSDPMRPESPGPSLDSHAFGFEKDAEGVKISFRAGGEKIFYERLKGAMTQRKWLLQDAPPIPNPYQSHSAISVTSRDGDVLQDTRDSRPKVVGIAGLERRGLELRKKNEAVIGGAFEDLEALMASAKEIVALAEKFTHQSTEKDSEGDALLAESATALGMVTTKDMLGSSSGSDSLYLSELSRNVAEYLTDDAKGILRKEGGIMSLVDLWAVFNRTRGGVELISPADFEKAARLWDKLALPVRLREFKNGLLVVQRHDWTDDKTIARLLAWLQESHVLAPNTDVAWDWARFGSGVTAQEAAIRFGWSIGVASEELEMAEEKGALCREAGVEGIKYWENWILHGDDGTPQEPNVTARLEDLEV
ncbi:MAG: hypothetical protein Q9207_002586 [Kuettlingeria erythrocarpa]